jgi:DNA-binding MarR family transcriptional regulator
VSIKQRSPFLDKELKNKIAGLAKNSRETSRIPVVRAYKAIFTTFDVVDTYIRLSLHDEEVSRAGKSILHILIENGGSITATEISQHAWRSKYATIRVIDTLERDGYVTRKQPENSGDRRKKMITITAKGVELFEKTFQITMEQLCPQVLGGLTEEQIADCYRILELIGSHTYELVRPFEGSYIYKKP